MDSSIPQLIRRKDLLLQIGFTESMLYEQVTAGTFPKPIKIGPKAVAWLESEVNEWLNQRIALRDDEHTTKKTGGQNIDA
ncbi:MAG: AlpA family transcriptional regulator [Marinobacterium sp.]|nr:AlpA family transcriptional regulator [Marinobacterium sp.]